VSSRGEALVRARVAVPGHELLPGPGGGPGPDALVTQHGRSEDCVVLLRGDNVFRVYVSPTISKNGETVVCRARGDIRFGRPERRLLHRLASCGGPMRLDPTDEPKRLRQALRRLLELTSHEDPLSRGSLAGHSACELNLNLFRVRWEPANLWNDRIARLRDLALEGLRRVPKELPCRELPQVLEKPLGGGVPDHEVTAFQMETGTIELHADPGQWVGRHINEPAGLDFLSMFRAAAESALTSVSWVDRRMTAFSGKNGQEYKDSLWSRLSVGAVRVDRDRGRIVVVEVHDPEDTWANLDDLRTQLDSMGEAGVIVAGELRDLVGRQ
jgi:hypothetical protein